MKSFSDVHGALARVKNGLARLPNVFGIHSNRARYVWVTGCLAFMLFGAAWIAEIRVASSIHSALVIDQSHQRPARTACRAILATGYRVR